jgi:hypothetical protein
MGRAMSTAAAQITSLRRRDHRGTRPVRARAAVLQMLARAKRSGGPEDRALYECGCGHLFKAEVSTSVGCPHCGAGQAW